MIIGSNLLFFQNLPSTNSHAAGLLKKSRLTEGTILYTNYQSAGKGYSGNRWESEDGKNLLISVILYPSFLEPEDQFLISMVISLGVCDFLKRYIPDCSVKWPNDIYVNNDKIAGILIESSLTGNHIDFTIAGIGLNINQEKFLSNAPNPVSLHLLSGLTYEPGDCLNNLTTDLDKRYKQLIGGDFKQIKEEYISKLYRLNEWNKFRDAGGIFTGRIITVGDFGRIKIEKQNGNLSDYSFKEIEFIL
jgi:BirA family transcriptional regulator, biotin operon repressor / biotin---[acetyl-CoA-carboxylase] ligase